MIFIVDGWRVVFNDEMERRLVLEVEFSKKENWKGNSFDSAVLNCSMYKICVCSLASSCLDV